jgi:hypothetical protein
MRNASWFVSGPNASPPRLTAAGRFAALALLLGCALFAPAARAATDAPPSAAAAAADDQALLEFAEAAPVTASEHNELVAQTREGFEKSPKDVQRADAVLREVLAKLPTLKPADAETIREELRMRLAKLPPESLEWQILEKHDPTVASDADHSHVVTARTVVVIRQATSWLATQLAVAGPGDDFDKTETAFIHKNFARFTSDEKDACAHIARNMAASIQLYDGLSPEDRKARLARARSVINGSVPLDVVAVLAMADTNALSSYESRFLATTARVFQLQNTALLVQGLMGLSAGPHF